MAKKVAVLAVNPVNGFGLFQYLEAFFENGISYKVYAVAETKEIKTNSGIELVADDVIANLIGHEDDFDALVFACGDAVPVFAQNADKPYNVDLMSVLKAFAGKGKILIGHCAAGLLFDFAGITEGKRLAVHPLAKSISATHKGIKSVRPQICFSPSTFSADVPLRSITLSKLYFIVSIFRNCRPNIGNFYIGRH